MMSSARQKSVKDFCPEFMQDNIRRSHVRVAESGRELKIESAEAALQLFHQRRTLNPAGASQGVTGISQLRFVTLQSRVLAYIYMANLLLFLLFPHTKLIRFSLSRKNTRTYTHGGPTSVMSHYRKHTSCMDISVKYGDIWRAHP
jgi:hypothetical protein